MRLLFGGRGGGAWESSAVRWVLGVVGGGRMLRSLSGGIVSVRVRVNGIASRSVVYLCSVVVLLGCLLWCSGARVVLLCGNRVRHWAVVCGMLSVCAVVHCRTHRLRRAVS
jgi:hypothetical protein